jgi:iron complex transport system substrate-binding protein
MGTIRSLNKGIVRIIVLMLAFALLGIACKKKEKTSSTKQKTKDSFPLTLTDDSGRKVKIKSKPKRIISLAPSNTEILFALGLDDEIVGVTTYCDYPKAAKEKEKIGSFAQPNIEKVIAQ